MNNEVASASAAADVVVAAKPSGEYAQVSFLLCPDQVYEGECKNPLCEKGLHVQASLVKAIALESGVKKTRKVCTFHYGTACKKGDTCTFVHVSKDMVDARRPAEVPPTSSYAGAAASITVNVIVTSVTAVYSFVTGRK